MLHRAAALVLVALLAVPAGLVPCDCCAAPASVEREEGGHACCQPPGPVLREPAPRCCLTKDAPAGGATTLPGTGAALTPPSPVPHPESPATTAPSRHVVPVPLSHLSPRPHLRI